MEKNKIDKNVFIQGVKDSLPIVFGYMPIGLAFGMIAAANGLRPIDVFCMSVIVFAGSSQFIAVDMIANHIHPVSIILTTFFVNFRHFLMSAAYAPYLKKENQIKLSCLSYFVTDESFAVGVNRAREKSSTFGADYLIIMGATAYCSWIAFTTLGSFIGQFVPDYYVLGFDFALTGMFIGLLALMIGTKKELIIALLAGLISTGLKQAGMLNWNVILAAVVAAFIGVLVGGYNARNNN